MHKSTLFIPACLSLFACGGASSNDLFTETVVQRQEDGTFTQSVSWVTEEQMLAHSAARTAQAKASAGGSTAPTLATEALVPTQGACSLDAIEFWDGFNATGNTICFYGSTQTLRKLGAPDPQMLVNYRRGSTGNWSGHVRSYTGAAGNPNTDCNGESGLFGNYSSRLGGGFVSCGESFSCDGYSNQGPWGGYQNAGVCAQGASVIEILN
jgi:hypothetical protein